MEWKILPICLLLLLSVFLIQQVSSQELSCKGRCFESFARGRECDCDSQCKKFGKCCSDYETFCEEVHNPTTPPPSKTAPPPPGASQTIKSTSKRSPKSPKKKTKKVIESEEITEEHSVSENQESSSSSSSSSSTIRKIKSSKNSAANKELQKKPKVNDDKKKPPKKEPPVVDEAGSGLDSGDPKLTPTPDTPTTQNNKVTTSPKTPTIKPESLKPSPPPNSDTSQKTSSTANKETTVETKETTVTNQQTSTSEKQKTTSAKEIRSAEKTSAKDLAPTPEVPAKPTPKAETTTPKEPAPTTPKEPVPTTPKEPAPTTPKKPAPTTPKTPAPATTMELPTTPKTPAEATPEFSAGPTPKAPDNSAKEPTVPTTKTPEVTTAAVPKITTKETATTAEEKTTESEIARTTMQVTPTTQDSSFKTTTLKTTPTEESRNEPEESPGPEDTATDSKATTPKPQKPTKAPKKPTSTKKPPKAPKKPTPTKKPSSPKGKTPKTTPTPPKTTIPPISPKAMLQTTTSPKQTPDSETVEVNPNNEDAEGDGGEKPHMIPRPPVLTPIVIPGTDHIVRGPSQGISSHSLLLDDTNLCNGRPVDGLTTLRNGTLVAFRGHYFWMLNPFTPPPPPRRITEVWGIPSPIDTVFTRCNCEGKTFFFKDSQYWRFTNDVQDAGYPKQIVKGFGGLTGKIVAALSVAKYKDRPESVYFFKRGGNVQQYVYKQEPVRKCTGRRPAINYSVYGDAAQVRRRRFERAIGPQTHTIRIHYTPVVRVSYQDKGTLHNEVKMSTMWRGLPNVVTSAITLPNIRRPDGYDYYAFSKDQYYNVNVPSRTARAVTTRDGKTLSKVWYKCP
ncbi:proteoglycan 4 isoform X2 [Marmota marmota marmota]|uniref:proteoglycan 4 isoform X2 n=1 Tax=Marmota marmota marmota TaxID=9994 RepID=UPI0020931968|nr:proteoglycan 4 isoform X2 [Marmota marmota marmota]